MDKEKEDNKTSTTKAWAIVDAKSGKLQRYPSRGYMVDPEQTPQERLHKTFKSVPCIVTIVSGGLPV